MNAESVLDYRYQNRRRIPRFRGTGKAKELFGAAPDIYGDQAVTFQIIGAGCDNFRGFFEVRKSIALIFYRHIYVVQNFWVEVDLVDDPFWNEDSAVRLKSVVDPVVLSEKTVDCLHRIIRIGAVRIS